MQVRLAFVLSTSGFLIFAVVLGVSRYGRIRLGQDGEKPEFRTSSWVAMMFSALRSVGAAVAPDEGEAEESRARVRARDPVEAA